MTDTPNSITRKFKEQVDYLISQGVVANKQEIVDALGWNKSQMSVVIKGTKNIPLAVYRKFTSKYKLIEEPLEAISDTGDFRDKYIKSLEDQLAMAREQLNLATGELRHIAVMNFAMLKGLRGPIAKLLAKAEREDLLVIAGKLDKETASLYRSVRERGSLVDLGI